MSATYIAGSKTVHIVSKKFELAVQSIFLSGHSSKYMCSSWKIELIWNSLVYPQAFDEQQPMNKQLWYYFHNSEYIFCIDIELVMT